ncbi:MAG: hypothetical protein ACR2PK_13480 [Acidimicrobiales bacterium]
MPGRYEIDVKGRLGSEMLHALSDVEPEVRRDSTRFRVEDDQPALHGLLVRLRDLGLEIEAVWRID